VNKKCTVGQATDDNIIRRMRVHEATDMHSECVRVIAFAL
jgi:hypothetical protein